MIEAKRYLDVASAQVGRSLLEAHGIAAFVAADNEGGMVPYLSYLTGVRLLVQPDQLEEARRLLAEAEAGDGADAVGDAWRQGEASEAPSAEADRERERAGSATFGRPSSPSLIAYRAAIFGIFLFPVGLHLYSLYFVFRAFSSWSSSSSRARWQTVVALLIDVTIIGIALYFVAAARA